MSTFPKLFPVFETERLLIRDVTLEDKEGLFRNYTDPMVIQYVMAPLKNMEVAVRSIEAFKGKFQEQKAITWAIELKESAEFIGTITYEVKSNNRAELGFDLEPTYWGQGYMCETLRRVIQFGFEDLEVDKIEANTVLLNTRTIQLLKRLDFQVDGVLRENTVIAGKAMDEIFFSINRAGWQEEAN